MSFFANRHIHALRKTIMADHPTIAVTIRFPIGRRTLECCSPSVSAAELPHCQPSFASSLLLGCGGASAGQEGS